MYIKEIYLGDFGIFNREKISKLNSGLVVIGGANRAGKTTFMQVLRHLGYGFPRDGSLPAPTDKYDVAARLKGDKERFDGCEFEIKLRGYAEPAVTLVSDGDNYCRNEREMVETSRTLFNDLDRFTYRQIFTISLEELRKKPEGVSNQKERQRLQAVLLGAGLSKTVELPRIARRHERRASNIAGKYGKPGVGKLKPYSQQIEEAEKERQNALEQVKEYREVDERIDELKQNRRELKKEIERLDEKQLRIDVLKNNFDSLEEMRKISAQLKSHPGKEPMTSNVEYSSAQKRQVENLLEQWESIKEECRKKSQIFASMLPASSRLRSETSATYNVYNVCDRKSPLESAREAIMEHAGKIKNYSARLSGLKERVNSIEERQLQLRQNFRSLREEAEKISPALAGDPENLKDIPADMIERDKLARAGEKRRQLEDELTRLEQKKDELKEEQESIEKRQEEIQYEAEAASRARSYSLSGLALSAVMAAVLVIADPAPFIFYGGSTVAVVIVALSLGFQVSRHLRSQRAKSRIENLNRQLEEIRSEIDDVRNKSRKRRENLADVEDELNRYRRLLNLESEDEKISASLLINYYNAVAGLKSEYMRIEEEKEKLASDEESLQSELQEIRNILQSIDGSVTGNLFSLPPSKELIDESEILFNSLNNAADLLEKAKDLTVCHRQMYELGGKIKKELEQLIYEVYEADDEADKINNIQESKIDPGELLTEFIQRAGKALEYKELLDRHDTLKKQLEDTLNSSERLKSAFPEGLQGLKNLFHKFSSSSEIEKAETEVSSKLEKLQEESAEISEKLSSMRHKKEELASPDSLNRAQSRLDRARSKMRELAEEYAINQTVSFLLRRVREKVMDKAEKELLDPAAELLAEMTSGDYKDIRSEEESFQALTSATGKALSPDLLSRATREQLYLAVRFSRIKDIDPPLPVILDDTLANFDRKHLSQAAHIIGRLADRNQIFVLTCHPELIKMLEGGQHWLLDKGEFSKVNAEVLVDELSAK